MSDHLKSLADFFLSKCTYLADTTILGLEHPPTSTDLPLNCPVCLSSLASIEHRIIQVNVHPCHHIFDADCLSRYILSGFNKCPLCRKVWFDIPHDIAAARRISNDIPLGVGLLTLEEAMSNIALITRNYIRDMRRAEEGQEGVINLPAATHSDIEEARERPVTLINHENWREWRTQESRRNENDRFFNWSSSDEDANVGDDVI